MDIEVLPYKSVDVLFEWSGLYTLEFRRCKENLDINTLDNEALIDFINEGELVQNFTFRVERT